MHLTLAQACQLYALLMQSKNTLGLSWVDDLLGNLYLLIEDVERTGHVVELKLEIST